MTQILVFGTSTPYGAWDVEGGWVQRLRKYLDEKQIKDEDLYYIVYNLGIPGNTSTDILERVDFEAKQRLKDIEDDEEVIILLSCGGNDSLFNNKTGKNKVSLESCISNINQIIQTCKKYTNQIIFIGSKSIDESKVDPVPWLPGWSYKEDLAERYEKEIGKLCNKEKIHFIDSYNLFKKQKNWKKLLVDGVHPSSEGHRIIFEIVKDFLVKEKII